MATAYTPDINQMRTQYANVLADQQKKALRGVQDIYAQRGTTGSGEESLAFGEGQRQFGLGAGQAEAGLQQYFGNLGMQQAGLGEQQRQFDTGQGNWQKQFGLQEAGMTGMYNGQQTQQAQAQQFGQNMALLPYVTQGYLGQNAWGGANPFGQVTTEAGINAQNPKEILAKKLGLASSAEMEAFAAADPGHFRDLMFKYGLA